MRLFKTKEFARLARKAKLTDDDLRGVIRRVEAGQIDAQIGKFLIKQRVASESRGKAKAFRTIICHVIGTRAVFLDLFAKKRQFEPDSDRNRDLQGCGEGNRRPLGRDRQSARRPTRVDRDHG